MKGRCREDAGGIVSHPHKGIGRLCMTPGMDIGSLSRDEEKRRREAPCFLLTARP
jgi:hypothetical protein